MNYLHENLTMYHNIHYKYYTYTLTEPHHWHSAGKLDCYRSNNWNHVHVIHFNKNSSAFSLNQVIIINSYLINGPAVSPIEFNAIHLTQCCLLSIFIHIQCEHFHLILLIWFDLYLYDLSCNMQIFMCGQKYLLAPMLFN